MPRIHLDLTPEQVREKYDIARVRIADGLDARTPDVEQITLAFYRGLVNGDLEQSRDSWRADCLENGKRLANAEANYKHVAKERDELRKTLDGYPHDEDLQYALGHARRLIAGHRERSQPETIRISLALELSEALIAATDRFSVARGYKTPAPIPMRLPCPECGELHIDEGEFATKVHATHSCQHCGLTWRPAVVPTVGVRFLPGFKDATPPVPAPSINPQEVVCKCGHGRTDHVLGSDRCDRCKCALGVIAGCRKFRPADEEIIPITITMEVYANCGCRVDAHPRENPTYAQRTAMPKSAAFCSAGWPK